MKDSIIQWIHHFYETTENGVKTFNSVAFDRQAPFWSAGLFVALVVISLILWWLARNVLRMILNTIADKSATSIDDHLISNKVFRAIGYLLPFTFMEYFFSIVFYQYPRWYAFSNKVVDILIITVILVSIYRTLNAIRDIINEKEIYQDKPIQSYFQISKIVVTSIFVILILARLTNQTPLFFITSLGAATAILVLVFKDTILGFVGSVQLSTNNMIRINDWITMDKYAADGYVMEINVATVKVQNFDYTISTIPTYAFISDSFKNWRGMQESGGRRIKRSLFIQMNSIQFASDELLDKLSGIKILSDYVLKTQTDMEIYNKENGFGKDDFINARRQTNIGLFRMYIQRYLENHPEINPDMYIMSRQLAPTPNGLPLEVYCFTFIQEWTRYERVMSDIFDHLFATVKSFELELFENPTGSDVRGMIGLKK